MNMTNAEPTESIDTSAPARGPAPPVNPPPAGSVTESVAQALDDDSGTPGQRFVLIPKPMPAEPYPDHPVARILSEAGGGSLEDS